MYPCTRIGRGARHQQDAEQSASVVLASFRGSTSSRTFLISEVLEVFFRSPKLILEANGPHEVWYVPPCLFAGCGLALGKRLSWQTQGGRVKSLNCLSILRERASLLCRSSFSEACQDDLRGARMLFCSPVVYAEAGAKPVPKRKLP